MAIREMYEDHSLYSLLNACEGFFENRKHKEKEAWEMTRIISFYSAQSTKINRAMDLFPLPWDHQNRKKQTMTKDQVMKLIGKK